MNEPRKVPNTTVPYRTLISPQFNEELFNELRDELAWLNVAGNRLEYWWNTLGKHYTYGRGAGQRTYQCQPPHGTLDRLQDCMKVWTDIDYEGCFLNYYRTERDHLGWHSDDDPGIDHNYGIAVLTLGAGREIQFTKRADAKLTHEELMDPIIYEQFLEPGSLLYMPPGFQQEWLHRIPKAGRVVGPRISLTYRKLLP